MSVEYRELSNNNLESRVVFFGKANCEPNHFFTGNNVRKEYVIHYILKGKGVFASANHAAVTLHAGDLFCPKMSPVFIRLMNKNLGHTSGLVYLVSKFRQCYLDQS